MEVRRVARPGYGSASPTRPGPARRHERAWWSRVSLDHFVRAKQQLLRNNKPDRLRALEIDDELDLRGLLDGHVAGLCALEDLVHVGGCPIEMFRDVLSVT